MPTAPIRVVYVAGSGHTGSTLLALLMDSHPEIACVGETSVKPKIRRRGDETAHRCSCGELVVDCTFWNRVADNVQAQGQAFGTSTWTNDYRFEHPLARRVQNRACLSAVGRQAVHWAARHLPGYRERVAQTDRVNLAFMRAVLQVSGAGVFGDTSKRLVRLVHLMRLPEVDLRLVLLVRDVRGYAASAKRRGFPVFDAARTWQHDQRAFAAVARGLPAERVHRLRYEDLCASPQDTLSALWAFCGVGRFPAPELVDARQHHVLGNSMRMGGEIRIRLDQSWRERLDGNEAHRILEIAGETNRKLGYV
jgi:hypothetical protein